ncbi:site-specific DNA-methyltransferase [Chitinophaga varians]|uniref:site-specific DNA-methyltransferase (adenine-specific) n=1 Tax=Chitinophaga varians TaxID=2202339 RepID=A0A847RNH4_9BACT|nr:site-specific DNA-methyltransferase [Chitinophaga varians]NLR68539.1 site-specific DNA-methyltransferase [Chitinophaga varians]
MEKLGLKIEESIDSVENYKFEPIKGYPMLHWKGKRPFTATPYFPAQLKEQHGQEINGWINKIFWGDNLQVMAHLLKQYRGQVDLIYIDPPFDSKADYKKTIRLKGVQAQNNATAFEEKQYSDIWNNDEYLQFMYERVILLKELLSDKGHIFLHCDWHKSHYLRLILDEIFGSENFRNEIIWVRSTNPKGSQHAASRFSTFTDTILLYSKSALASLRLDRIRRPLNEEEIAEKYHRIDDKGKFYDGPIIRSLSMGERPNLVYEYKGYTPPASGWRVKKETLKKIDAEGNLGWSSNDVPFRKLRPEDDKGNPIGNIWDDISLINSQAQERVGYPTQKPIDLLKRIILASTEPGDLVFDCFMGSGTTQVAAMELGRKFIGADINLGAIQTTTKRLIHHSVSLNQVIAEPSLDMDTDEQIEEEENEKSISTIYTGFQVYNVNHYDVFRNPVQAKELLIKALEIQPLPNNALYDGEKDGRMVKIMPVNRIATRADLNELITGFDYKVFEKRNTENPGRAVEYLLLVCMGHEADLAAALQKQMPYKLDIEVVDILRDKSNLEFKRDSEAKISIDSESLTIEQFYPMNLLQKLSLMKEHVEDWKELTESIMIDFNFDGAVFEPQVIDIPSKEELVAGKYPVPQNAGTIKIRITDLLSESFEMELVN